MRISASLLTAFLALSSSVAGCSSNTQQQHDSQASAVNSSDLDLGHQQNKTTMQSKIMQFATVWEDKPFRVGKAEQCMNWTREVLAAACGPKFRTLETDNPWDAHLLGDGDKLLPEHADSLASETLGKKIFSIEQLQQGDLVFLKNTYGNWTDGVITHIGIATGNGEYIHRMTSNKGIVKIQAIDPTEFDAGLRLSRDLCE